jgi:hypothetical protein
MRPEVAWPGFNNSDITMLPNFLFPEQAVTKDGEGPSIDIEGAAGKSIQLTLGITEVLEQESLDVAIYGSTDGNEWGPKPITAFPQKFYQGMYSIVLDLTATPDIRFLKVKYKTNRWGHWTSGPEFKFFVYAEPVAG